MLKDALRDLGLVFGVGAAFHEGKKLLIDFNRDMESMRISAAAMLQANSLAKNFDQATSAAEKMVGEYTKFAITSPVTTKDLVQFSNGVITAVAQAGGARKDVINVAEQGVIAAKAFMMDADTASREISMSIQRGAHERERFAAVLIKTQGVTLAAFNAMDPLKRLQLIEKALNSDAMTNAAKAFGRSWVGEISTLEDRLQITFGKIGQPLFHALTEEVHGWNTWLANNEDRIQGWGESLTHYLKEGFGAVKTAVSFLLDHKDAIMAIGEVWAVSKFAGFLMPGGAGGALGGGMGGLLGGLTGTNMRTGELTRGMAGLYNNAMALRSPGMAMGAHASALSQTATGPALMNMMGGAAMGYAITKFTGETDKLNSGVTVLAGALATLPGPIGLVGTALLGLELGLQMLDKQAKTYDEKMGNANAVLDYYQKAIYKGSYNGFLELAAHAKSAGAVNDKGEFNKTVFERQLRAETGHLLDDEMFHKISVATATAFFNPAIKNLYTKDTFDPEAEKRNKPIKQNMHVEVKIEVASDDPDRFAFRLGRVLKRMGRNPTAAADALRDE
jgi:hypothetical protein